MSGNSHLSTPRPIIGKLGTRKNLGCFGEMEFPGNPRERSRETGAPVIGYFSVDRDQTVRFDRSNAKYLYQKHVDRNVRIDLNIGMERYENWVAPSDVKYQSLCRWVMHQDPDNCDIKQALQGADILCSRGILKKIAVSPFNYRNAWSFYAVKMNGVIFLCEGVRESGELRNAYENRATYWGQKFEQSMQVDSKHGVPRTNEPVVIGNDYRIVVSSTLTGGIGSRKDPIQLVIGGEVDCLDSDGRAVELKTHANCLDHKFWRNKSRDTYLQCRLLGVSHVVVGIRDMDGQLEKVVKLSMEELRQGGSSYWDANKCLNYLHSTLADVRTILQTNRACFVEKLRDSPTVLKSTSVSSRDLEFLPVDFKNHFNLF